MLGVGRLDGDGALHGVEIASILACDHHSDDWPLKVIVLLYFITIK